MTPAEITKELAEKYRLPSQMGPALTLPNQIKTRVREYIKNTNPSIMQDKGKYRDEEVKLIQKLYATYEDSKDLEKVLKSPLQF
jgi:hypothetical protein